jgi:hypothetical protein
MSSMICLTYTKCSINFTSWYTQSWVYYKWIFWNWEKYYWANPKSQKFSPWFYLVKLITSDKYWNRKVEHYRITVKKLLKKSEIKEAKEKIINIINYKKNIYLELNKKLEITKQINKINKKIVKNIKKKLTKKKVKKLLTVKNIFW